MSAHTPGPWEAVIRAGKPGTVEYGSAFVKGGNPSMIVGDALYGRNTTGNDEFAANARLIAAAPELLAALVVAEAFISIAVPERAIDRNEAIFEVIPQIRAAVAKATEAT